MQAILADAAMTSGDALEATGNVVGDSIRKRGEFVPTLDSGLARGAQVRVVIEAKNRSVPCEATRATG